MFKNVLIPSFSGTVSRRTYWLSALTITAISIFAVLLLGGKADSLNLVFALMYDTTGGFIVLPLIALMPLIGFIFLFSLGGSISGSLLGLILNVWILYSALVLLGLQVRRLRERNKSSLYTLLPFIPIPILNFVGLGYLIYLLSSNNKEVTGSAAETSDSTQFTQPQV